MRGASDLLVAGGEPPADPEPTHTGAGTRDHRWVRRLNLVIFLGVIVGGIWWVVVVRQLSERIVVRVEYLDLPATSTGTPPFGIGSDLFRAYGSDPEGPWSLGAGGGPSLRLEVGETWQTAIERTYPSIDVITFSKTRDEGRFVRLVPNAIEEIATVVLQIPGEPLEAYLAIAVRCGEQQDQGKGLPALLLRLNVPPTHEFAVRGRTWSRQPRSWFEVITGKPKYSVIISAFRGKRSIGDAIRWADGSPWAGEILRRGFSTEW